MCLIVESGNEGNLHLFWMTLKWFMSGNEIKSETITVQRGTWRGSEDERQWMERREREREVLQTEKEQKEKETSVFGSRWRHRFSSLSSGCGNNPGRSDASHGGRFSPSCAQIGWQGHTSGHTSDAWSRVQPNSNRERFWHKTQQCNALVTVCLVAHAGCYQCWKNPRWRALDIFFPCILEFWKE